MQQHHNLSFWAGLPSPSLTLITFQVADTGWEVATGQALPLGPCSSPCSFIPRGSWKHYPFTRSPLSHPLLLSGNRSMPPPLESAPGFFQAGLLVPFSVLQKLPGKICFILFICLSLFPKYTLHTVSWRGLQSVLSFLALILAFPYSPN